jgi:ABC-2 type transport system permease protein
LPIYEQSYRRYQAREPLREIRFWPIAREALRQVLAKRLFLGLLVIAWLPLLLRLVLVFAATQFPGAARLLELDGKMFGEFLNQQVELTLLLSAFGGAALIANDLRTGAILVYLSRPLSRRDYVAGKLTMLLALNLSATLVPGLVLYVASLGLAPKIFAQWSLAWIVPAILAQSLLMSLVASLVALTVSALSRSARVAGLAFVLLWVGLALIGELLQSVLSAPVVSLVSLDHDIRLVGGALFGLPADSDLHWSLAALVLLAVAAGCLSVLRTRVRAVEVVT